MERSQGKSSGMGNSPNRCIQPLGDRQHQPSASQYRPNAKHAKQSKARKAKLAHTTHSASMHHMLEAG